jgi:hypothetical protein
MRAWRIARKLVYLVALIPAYLLVTGVADAITEVSRTLVAALGGG